MGDAEFIAYCQTHSETELAMFNGAQIGRLLTLAGNPHNNAADWSARPDKWVSVDLSELCAAALRAIGDTHDD